MLFICSGKVVFGIGAVMMVAAMPARTPRWLRAAVIAYGLLVAGWMLTHR